MLVLSGTLVGSLKAFELRRDRDLMKSLVRLTELTAIYLSSDGLSARELFSRLAAHRELGELNFLKAFDCGGAATGICEALRTDTAYLDDDVKDKLITYFGEFGSTDLEGQLAKNRLLKAELSQALERSAERYDKYSRLYKILGFSCGVMLAVMLI